MIIRDDAFVFETKGVQCLAKIIKNDCENEIKITDCIYKKIVLPKTFIHVEYYTSSWGKEFMKQSICVETEFGFENAMGRCGAQSNPFFTVGNGHEKIDIAIATSINYRVEITNKQSHIEVIIRDVHEAFCVTLQPNEQYEYPKLYAHRYQGLKQCYQEKQEYMQTFYETYQLHNDLLVVYNHWWAYEDLHINEEVILQNAKIGKEIGIEMLVLDAGWFGNNQSDEHWFTMRGDWMSENRERFPHGIAYVSKQIKAMNLKFGIWCEFEGLGEHAKILEKYPTYQARRDGEPLGYACFGNPEVQTWAIQFMSALFDNYQADYWKLDFNLDPKLGCNDETHGHESGNGLQAHEQGVYHVLYILRERYPHIVIENCSSGGQRINLAMAQYTDVHFMSDPDYSSHQLRLFIEISKWLLPRQILHFMWSNTVTTNATSPFVNLDVNQCSTKELQYHMRISFLHHMGISRRLPEHNPEKLAIMKQELTLYKETLRSFVKDGIYYPLVLDEDVQAFQYTLKDETLLFVFAQKAGTYKIHIEQKAGIIMDIDSLQKEHLISNCLLVDMEEDFICRLFIIYN